MLPSSYESENKTATEHPAPHFIGAGDDQKGDRGDALLCTGSNCLPTIWREHICQPFMEHDS